MITGKPLLLAQVAERLLCLDGKPFSLDNYPMYRSIYNGRYRSTLLMCGRQVAKSTSWANFIIAESVSIKHFKSYYVSPSREQTLIFSNTRLGKVLAYSPLIKKFFQSPEHADRVLHRSYTNGAENAFTYAADDPDRARGFSADRVLYDEIQDMIYDAVIPVINECMAMSKHKFESYAGTPKSMEASIQFLWDKSSKTEWVMRCIGCGSHNYIASEKSLGLHGPICLKCGHVLNPRLGFWVDTNPKDPDPKVRQIKGFHIPQLIMPENVPCASPSTGEAQAIAQSNWDHILNKMATYSEARFRNEVLGVSDALGDRLVSLAELQAMCIGPMIDTKLNVAAGGNANGVSRVVAGCDWSGGGSEGKSRTVLWIWGWVPAESKLRTLYFKVFNGANAVNDVKEIIRTCSAFNVEMFVGDAGEGHLANSEVRAGLGPHRCTMVRYHGAMSGKSIAWNGSDTYVCSKTALIDNYMMLLKRQGVTFPSYSVMKTPIDDILAEYEEVTTGGQKIWTHSPMIPDDCLHAQIFGWFAFKLAAGDLKLYA